MSNFYPTSKGFIPTGSPELNALRMDGDKPWSSVSKFLQYCQSNRVTLCNYTTILVDLDGVPTYLWNPYELTNFIVKVEDGFSPSAEVSKEGHVTTIRVTDKEGTTEAEVTDGSDGVSPTIQITDIAGGHRLTITDKLHPQGISVDVMDGSNGVSPSANVVKSGSTSVLTVTDVNGTTQVNINDGSNGEPGYSPTVSSSKSGKVTTITIRDKNGDHEFQVNDGDDGYSPSAQVTQTPSGALIEFEDKSGQSSAVVSNGSPGEDGISPNITVTDIDGGHQVTITDKLHPQGQTFTILNGSDGYSPTVSSSKSGKVTTVIITDKNGAHEFQVNDGLDGDNGVSPTVTVTDILGGHRITFTDVDHPQGLSFDVMDGNDVTEIFWATYGVTTSTEIQAALDAGKVVLCKNSTFIYMLTDNNSSSFRFFSFYNICTFKSFSVSKSSGAWSGISTYSSLLTIDKISSTSSMQPNDDKLYTALATKNLINAVDNKIGTPISLTFTYDDDVTETYSLLTSPTNNS